MDALEVNNKLTQSCDDHLKFIIMVISSSLSKSLFVPVYWFNFMWPQTRNSATLATSRWLSVQ